MFSNKQVRIYNKSGKLLHLFELSEDQNVFICESSGKNANAVFTGEGKKNAVEKSFDKKAMISDFEKKLDQSIVSEIDQYLLFLQIDSIDKKLKFYLEVDQTFYLMSDHQLDDLKEFIKKHVSSMRILYSSLYLDKDAKNDYCFEDFKKSISNFCRSNLKQKEQRSSAQSFLEQPEEKKTNVENYIQ